MVGQHRRFVESFEPGPAVALMVTREHSGFLKKTVKFFRRTAPAGVELHVFDDGSEGEELLTASNMAEIHSVLRCGCTEM